ncbi:MAG: tRNA guanosine(34) transglycosylase Tgt [Patescibacteria group bacterium]
MAFEVIVRDPHTRARAGILETPHGTVETPAYVVVGTHAKVRTLDTGDLQKTGIQLIIANTYHLWQTLGEGGLATYPGLHAAMGWSGPLMTDSGGFQVFSMGAMREHSVSKVGVPVESIFAGHFVKHRMFDKRNENHVHITKDGVMFITEGTLRQRDAGTGSMRSTSRNVGNGTRQWLDAEKSIRIQQQLGADIIFAFDEPTSPLHDYAYTKASLTRTHAWASRSLAARTSGQMMYGIVQGGSFEDLRKESARAISALPFDGFAVGGSYANSYGSTREHTICEVAWVTPLLPEDKPRHLLGIGLIPDIFSAVSAGMDTFDCVVPTREARHGSLWTKKGERIDIVKGKYRDDKTVLDEQCACMVCAEMKIEKGALHALFKARDPQAGRLATLHNVSFFNALMSRIRAAIKDSTFDRLRAEW